MAICHTVVLALDLVIWLTGRKRSEMMPDTETTARTKGCQRTLLISLGASQRLGLKWTKWFPRMTLGGKSQRSSGGSLMNKRSNVGKSNLLHLGGWKWKKIHLRAGTKWEAEGVPRSEAVLMAGTTAVPILRGSGFTGLVSKHHFVAGVALDISPQEHKCVWKEWVHITKIWNNIFRQTAYFVRPPSTHPPRSQLPWGISLLKADGSKIIFPTLLPHTFYDFEDSRFYFSY